MTQALEPTVSTQVRLVYDTPYLDAEYTQSVHTGAWVQCNRCCQLARAHRSRVRLSVCACVPVRMRMMHLCRLFTAEPKWIASLQYTVALLSVLLSDSVDSLKKTLNVRTHATVTSAPLLKRLELRPLALSTGTATTPSAYFAQSWKFQFQ